MTIVGLGMDATEIPRIAETLERYGKRFMQRVFTEHEIEYCLRRHHAAQHFAGRFAAKEAGMKAIGTGHSRGVLWRDIEVVRRAGPPQLLFHGAAAEHFKRAGATRALVTITHTDTLALAHVILTGDPGNHS
jgi:holo-[acyl-carrier protein] synthase